MKQGKICTEIVTKSDSEGCGSEKCLICCDVIVQCSLYRKCIFITIIEVVGSFGGNDWNQDKHTLDMIGNVEFLGECENLEELKEKLDEKMKGKYECL